MRRLLLVLVLASLLALLASAPAQAQTVSDVVRSTWSDPAEWETAEAVLLAESGGVECATGYYGDYGLFQFTPGTAAGFGTDYWRLGTDVYYASAEAARLQDALGWKPWVAYTSGAYLRHWGAGPYTPITFC